MGRTREGRGGASAGRGWELEPAGAGAAVPRRVPRPVAVLIVVVLAAVVGLVTRGSTPSPPPLSVETLPRDAAPTAVPEPADAAGGGDVAAVGGWRPMAAAPIDGRIGHVGVWTGSQLVVWGGWNGEERFADGAAYDADADRWRLLAAGPLGPRIGATAVWTGSEVVVWGGWDGETAHADGAAYDPVADAWRPIAAAPLAGRANAAGAWTGSEVLVWGGGDAGRHADGAAYDPATDRWRLLPPGPLTAESGRPPRMVWTGRDAFVWALPLLGSGGPVAARYDPAADAWSAVPSPPVDGRFDPNLALDAGGGSILAWGTRLGAGVTSAAARFDLASSTWHAIAKPPLRWRAHAVIADVGGDVAIWVGDTRASGAILLPDAGWTPMAHSPVPGRLGAVSVWTGAVLLFWGGHRADIAQSDGAVWSPAGAARRPLAPDRVIADARPPWHALPPDPLGRRLSASGTWTGSEVVVLGGLQRPAGAELDGAAFDPLTGRWRALPPAPTAPRFGHLAILAAPDDSPGGEIVVLGGYEVGGERPAPALALDPAAGTWRRIAQPEAALIAAVWAGDRLLALARDGAGAGRALVWDPVTDRWSDVAPPPMGGLAKALAWTGEVAVASTSRGDELAAYDPHADRWERLPPAPVRGSLAQLATVDGRVAVAVRSGDGWQTALLTEDGGAWLATGRAPAGTSALFLVETGDGILAVGRPGPQLAALDPASGAWTGLPDAPLPRRHGSVLAWTRDSLFVWGGGTSPDAAGLDGAVLAVDG